MCFQGVGKVRDQRFWPRLPSQMACFTTVISQRRKLRHRKVEGLPRITRVGLKPNNSGLAPPVLAWGAGVVGSCRRRWALIEAGARWGGGHLAFLIIPLGRAAC